MSTSQSITAQSWADVYQMLRARAETARGTVTLTPNGVPSVTFPHTTSRDAFAIFLVFDQAVNDHAAGGFAARWTWESDLLAGEPDGNVEPYVGNRSLWETLAAAAIELDRVRAPLPAPALIDDAMRELETTHATATLGTRNAGGTMLVTVFNEPTWSAMALRQLEFFSMLRGRTDGTHAFMCAVPTTCNADVLALAGYWTEQLARVGENASDTYHRLLYSCWREVLHQVAQYAKHAPAHEPYVRNPEFWRALLLLATQSDACDAPAMPWAFHVPESCHRNAAVPFDAGAAFGTFSAATWDQLAMMQRDAFSKRRGEDEVTGVTGAHVRRVPRTTIADVRQLAAYWSASLVYVGEHSHGDTSYRPVVDRWKAAIAQLGRIPSDADPSSVYAHNTEFWDALFSLSTQVAVTAEAPPRWQLAAEATGHAMLELPDTLRELPNTIKTAVQRLVTNALARPLMYAGLGIGGLAAALLLLRRAGKSETLP